MDENIPLLSISKLSTSQGGAKVDPYCSTDIGDSQTNDIKKRRYYCRWIIYRLSKCMIDNPKLLFRVKYVSCIILANSLLACLFILIMEVYDPTALHKWSNGYISVFGNWKIQLANCLLVLSSAMTDFLQLRIWLTISCISFMIYAFTSPTGIMADMGIFYFVMALLNIRHAVVQKNKTRYIEFAEEMEHIYITLFARYMTRVQFKEISDISMIRAAKARVTMWKEGDLVTSLCILVKGEVEVMREGRLLNVLCKNEILEAPEWVRSNLNPEGTRFTVSFVTATDVVYVKFTSELLAGIIKKDLTIRSAVLAVLGIRVSKLWLRSLDRKVDRAPSSNQHTGSYEAGYAPSLKLIKRWYSHMASRARITDDRSVTEKFDSVPITPKLELEKTLELRSLDQKVDQVPSSNQHTENYEAGNSPSLMLAKSYSSQGTSRARTRDDGLLVEKFESRSITPKLELEKTPECPAWENDPLQDSGRPRSHPMVKERAATGAWRKSVRIKLIT